MPESDADRRTAEPREWGRLLELAASEARVRLLALLSDGERPMADLARALGLSDSAALERLRALRSARLVEPRRDGRRISYRLTDRGRAVLRAAAELEGGGG